MSGVGSFSPAVASAAERVEPATALIGQGFDAAFARTLAGKRVTVMGLGTRGGGVGVARYLAELDAVVTVTDAKTEANLAPALAHLAGLPIRYVIGRHDERDFLPTGTDFVVRNPGVPRRAPLLQLARRHGVPIEMEMSLFFRACPAPIVGITGTKGKTTTSTLCAAMLRAWDARTVLAGNMGVSALGHLPAITPDTPVVLELSSWQVEALIEHRLAPRIVGLTNIAEDHLDHYDGFADYAETKRGITRYQRPGDTVIVNRDDPEAWLAAGMTAARAVPFGLRDHGADGAWRVDDRLVWRTNGTEQNVAIPPNPALAGSHNVANALAALAAAAVRGAPLSAIETGLRGYAGVKDRMEPVGEIAGVRYVNDTTATAPVATVAALNGLEPGRVHLIAGGSDKQTDLRPLAAAAVRHASAVYLLAGSATEQLATLLRNERCDPNGPFDSMSAAVAAAAAAARPGDVVLLSPGCASFGLFQDEFDRGEQFRRAVGALMTECGS